MNEEKLIEAMEHLDERFVEEAAPDNAAPMKGLRRKFTVRWVSVAAGICAFVILTVVLLNPLINNMTPRNEVIYTAEELGSMFNAAKNDGGTSSYTKVYVPSAKYLELSPLTIKRYLPIYEKTEAEKPLDKQELTSFYEGITARLEEKTGEGFPSGENIKEYTYGDDKELSLFAGPEEYGSYYACADQCNEYNYYFLRKSGSDGNADRSITLGDVKIQVDRSETDKKIIAGLDKIKKELFYVFGVEFSDVCIRRYYNSYSENGVSSLSVFFYNEKDHPINGRYDRNAPLSDYVVISFDNEENYEGDIVNDKILTDAVISYYQYRIDVSDLYPATKEAKRISLREAESLLKKGYVFGGHSCSICMSMQPEVDFSDYDYVEMKYVSARDSGGEISVIVPFYVFYKKTGLSENGNEAYAKTYVAAIEVIGYEEYFDLQKEKH